jgi:CheY-like chemotaxis protein/HPt (histidine-containing phosphotransfer) domain-containing protein
LASKFSQPQFNSELADKLPLKMLLVDDVEINQMVAVQMLQKLGYSPDVASSGQEALDALARVKYDIVFMDMQMPEMDGLETTRRIRQQFSDDCILENNGEESETLELDEPQNPKSINPWIIAMTANAMQGDRELCLNAGMNDYISKPVRVQAIVQALTQYDRICVQSQLNSHLDNREVELSHIHSQAETAKELLNSAPTIDEPAFEELKRLIARAGVLISQIESGNQSAISTLPGHSEEILGDIDNIQSEILPGLILANLPTENLVPETANPEIELPEIQLPPLDNQAYEELKDLLGEETDEFWLEIVEKFLEVAPPKLQEIADAVSQADCTAIRASAHALRGACTTVGVLPLFQLCMQLEDMARNQIVAGTEIMYLCLKVELSIVHLSMSTQEPNLLVIC